MLCLLFEAELILEDLELLFLRVVIKLDLVLDEPLSVRGPFDTEFSCLELFFYLFVVIKFARELLRKVLSVFDKLHCLLIVSPSFPGVNHELN
jgi:hypothetical protein